MLKLIETALTTLGKVLDKMPDYDDMKKENFHTIRKKLMNEKMKPQYTRDDNEIVRLEEEMRLYIEDFNSFLDRSVK